MLDVGGNESELLGSVENEEKASKNGSRPCYSKRSGGDKHTKVKGTNE